MQNLFFQDLCCHELFHIYKLSDRYSFSFFYQSARCRTEDAKGEDQSLVRIHAAGCTVHLLLCCDPVCPDLQKKLTGCPLEGLSFKSHPHKPGAKCRSTSFKCVHIHIGVRSGRRKVYESRFRSGVDFFQKCAVCERPDVLCCLQSDLIHHVYRFHLSHSSPAL